MRSTSSNATSSRWGDVGWSSTVTSCPAATRASTTWEPMKPLPPVTTVFTMTAS